MGRRVSEKKTKEQFLYERRRQLEIMEGISSICKGCDIYIELRKTKAHKEVANTCARNCKLISNVQKETKMFLETIL
ncbi:MULTISPECIES: hypothetical protein [Bacillus]|uniref:hypothetical protein n=1 Tax=Bacillus TaxID=1386 RepID=UPI000BEFBCEC|nr:hypothetical protein [Bacillus mycoides]PEK86271.1 hypothetical protein CN600_29100 [Bacillus mycoides]HDR7635517.1 hypothetical protein [Bacillus mycoides]